MVVLMISDCYQGKPFNIRVIQVCAPTTNDKEAEVEWFYEDLQDLLELTPEKRSHFHHRGLDDESRKSREVILGVTQYGLGVQNEAGQRLTEFCQENTLVITNTLFQQHKEDSTHGHHQMVKTEIRLIIFFATKDGEALYSQQKQDQELTVAQIMNSLLPNSHLKKVGKTTRPFRYDLNQIPYDYTVEVRNRFKGLDLIECLMNYGQKFMTLYRR